MASALEAHQLFSELRSITTGEPTSRRRHKLYELLDAFEDQADTSEQARFLCDYLPLVRQRLTHWPDIMLWSDESPFRPASLMLSKILRINLDALHEREELPKASEWQHLQGIWCTFSKEPLSELRRLATRLPPLTHIELELPSLLSEHNVQHTSHSVMRWVADTYAETLTHLSIPHDYTQALINTLDDLPQLTSLRITGSLNQLARHNWLDHLGHHPISQQLEALDLNIMSDAFQDAWIVTAHTWQNLKRLRLIGLPDERATNLIQSPHLSHITTWNLADNAAGRARHWHDFKTQLWTARAQNKGPQHILARSHVDIIMLPKAQRLKLFLDDNQNLYPSSQLEHLHLSVLDLEVIEALTSSGHAAYPNLTHLSALSTHFIPPQTFAAFALSPFFIQLHEFAPGRMELGDRYASSMEKRERQDWYAAWYALLEDDAHPLDVRARRIITTLMAAHTTESEHMLCLARAMKLKGRSTLTPELLKSRIHTELEFYNHSP